MTYYLNLDRRQKKDVFLKILIIITLIGCITTTILLGGFFYVNKMTGETLKKIETLKNNSESLKEEIRVSEENLKVYEKKIETLNETVLRFDPVIIPESMQKNKEKK